MLLVKPFNHLARRELRHAQFPGNSLQLIKRHPQQYLLFAVHNSYFGCKGRKKILNYLVFSENIAKFAH